MSASSPLADDTISQRLTRILDALCHTIASRAGRHRAAAPLVLLLWPYLRRLAARFARLAVCTRQNRVSAPSARPAGSPTQPNRLPRGFAWLVRFAPETAAFGSQLRHLLGQPEMAALLAATPQAGRILRPLCRMLGISPGPDVPPPLFPPPRTPRSARPIPPRAPAEPPTHEAGLTRPPDGWPVPA